MFSEKANDRFVFISFTGNKDTTARKVSAQHYEITQQAALELPTTFAPWSCSSS
jgi:hypothetical protein